MVTVAYEGHEGDGFWQWFELQVRDRATSACCGHVDLVCSMQRCLEPTKPVESSQDLSQRSSKENGKPAEPNEATPTETTPTDVKLDTEEITSTGGSGEGVKGEGEDSPDRLVPSSITEATPTTEVRLKLKQSSKRFSANSQKESQGEEAGVTASDERNQPEPEAVDGGDTTSTIPEDRAAVAGQVTSPTNQISESESTENLSVSSLLTQPAG